MSSQDGVREEIVYLSNDWKNAAGFKPIAFDFAEDFIILLTILPILLLPLRILNSGALAYFSTAFVPVDFILLTYNRRKAKKLGFFILFLIIISAAAFTLSILCRNYGAAVFMLIAAFVSGKKLKDTLLRQEKNFDRDKRVVSAVYMSEKSVIAGAVFCYIIYMAAVALGYRELLFLCVADYAADFALMLIYRHKSGSYCLSQWSKTEECGSLNQGDNKSKATGTMFIFWAVAGVCVITLLIILIVNLCGIDRVDTALIKWLAAVGSGHANAAPKRSAPISNNAPDMSKLLKSKQQKPTLILTILFEFVKILGYAVAIFAVILFIAAISRAIAGFYKKLHLSINEESRSLLSIDDTVAGVKEQIRRISRKWDDFAHGGNRMRIRRLFFAYVKKHGKGIIVKSSDSPLEIGGKVGIQLGYDMSNAARIYEKARYAEDECSSEDVKNMRKALK